MKVGGGCWSNPGEFRLAVGLPISGPSAFYPNLAARRAGHLVRLREGDEAIRVAGMVKVFGCRQAYENRPCTNLRACGDSLWGFQVLPVCGDGDPDEAMGAAATR